MVGVPVAGVLIAATSAPAVLAIDAATFFASGLLMLLLVPRSSQPAAHPEDEGSGYLRRLAQGFGHLRGDRLLLGIGFMVLVTNLVDAAVASVLLPLWGSERLGSPVGIGLMSGAFGLGAVSGNAALTWLGPRLSRRNVYAVGFLVAGAPRLVALAVADTVEPMLVVMFVTGFGAGSINPILGAVEFERVPRHLQARVIGAIGALAWAGIPIGPILGGAGAELLGLATALWLAAGVYLVVTLVPFIFPVWKEMDRRGPAGAEPAQDGAAEPTRAA
jgi:MFS family permease